MRIKSCRVLLGAALILVLPIAMTLLAASQASAALTTYQVTVTATNITAYGGNSPTQTPASSFQITFTVTFDPTQTYLDSTTGISLDSLSGITLDYPLTFDYSPTALTQVNDGGDILVNVEAGELVIGGAFEGPSRVRYTPATNGFTLTILNFTTNPTFNNLTYSQNPGTYSVSLFYTTSKTDGTVIVTPNTVWQNATNLGSDWYSLSWFGNFNTKSPPWIYHQQLGWLYPFAADTSNMWFWDLNMNTFVWTSQTIFPWLYSIAENTWLYYVKGTTNPSWFYNYKAGKYEAH